MKLSENIRFIFPIILLILILAGNIFFAVTIILPEWNAGTELSTQVAQAKQAAAEKMQPTEDESSIIQAQIENAETGLQAAGENFLTEELASTFLDSLYQYAEESDVEITTLQLQPSPPLAADDAVEASIFLLEVNGTTPHLMAFLIRAQETTAPGVVIKNLSITENVLKMEIQLYTSPYASEDVFASLPEPIIPPALMITPTATPPMMAAHASPTHSPIPVPSEIPSATPVIPSTVVGPGIYDDNHPAIRYTAGTWTEISSYSGYGGGYHYSLETTAELRLDFMGTGVAIQYVAFRNFGVFEIYIDDTLQQEVDAYAEKGVFGQVIAIDGLTDGQHTLVIRNTSRRNEISEGNVIAIDALYVLQSPDS